MQQNMEKTEFLHQVRVRIAQRADLPAMEWDGEYKHFRRLFWEAYQQMEQGDALMWVAEFLPASLAGQTFVQLRSGRSELADGLRRAYIYGFRIRPEYRNRGIGTYIMQVVETDLMARGYRWVNLNVAHDNPAARRLYERLGYQVVGADPGRWSYIDDQGIRRDIVEPAWRMQKILE